MEAIEELKWVHEVGVEVVLAQPIFCRLVVHFPLQGLSSLHRQVLSLSRPHALYKKPLNSSECV